MRSLYPVSLPRERAENEDKRLYDDLVAKNENCLNQNFYLIADKIYEFEARLAVLENASEE